MNECIEALEACGIDTKEGIDRFMKQEALFLKFLLRFLEEPDMKKIQEAYQKGDVQECFTAAHSLKSLVGNLAITSLYEPIKPFVETLRAGEFPEESEFISLQEKYDQVVCTLEKISAKNR